MVDALHHRGDAAPKQRLAPASRTRHLFGCHPGRGHDAFPALPRQLWHRSFRDGGRVPLAGPSSPAAIHDRLPAARPAAVHPSVARCRRAPWTGHSCGTAPREQARGWPAEPAGRRAAANPPLPREIAMRKLTLEPEALDVQSFAHRRRSCAAPGGRCGPPERVHAGRVVSLPHVAVQPRYPARHPDLVRLHGGLLHRGRLQDAGLSARDGLPHLSLLSTHAFTG